MKFVFLEPPYSSYFDALGTHLKRSGHDVSYFCPDKSLSIYYSNLTPSVFVPGNIRAQVESVVDSIINTPSLFNVDGGKLAPKYIAVIKDYIFSLSSSVRHDTVVVLYNDCRWNHAVAIQLFNLLGVKYLVFERGAVRGRSISVDPLGCNSRSQFYRQFRNSFKLKLNREVLDRERVEYKNANSMFALHSVIRFLQTFYGVGLRNNTRNHLIHYSRILFRKLTRKGSHTLVPNEYKYFVPLQIESDSQLIFGKRRFNNYDLLNFVKSCCDRFGVPYNSVVVKVHPMDSSRYSHPFSESSKSSQELLDSCKAVVTINSTVGFEALLSNVPVLCLGESFYTFTDWVYSESEADSFFKDSRNAKETGDNVIDEMLGSYMLPGDIYHFNDDDLADVVNYIERYAYC